MVVIYTKKINVGNTREDLSNFFSCILRSRYPKVIFFFKYYASKEKRAVEYSLIFSEFCCYKGGQIPLTSKLGSLVRTGGSLVRDEDIVTTCLSGDEEIQPSTTTSTSIKSTETTTTTTTSTTTTTDEVLEGIQILN